MAEYHVENFGCRASRADGESIAAALQARGLDAAEGFATADLLILNTCSVTAEADKDARAFVRKAKRLNPDARVVVTGCYAQRAPDEVAALPGVDRVVGNSHKVLVADIAADMAAEVAAELAGISNQLPPRGDLVPLSSLVPPLVDDQFAHSDMAFASPFQSSAGRTRPNLKVQDGCGNRCSFCVIPQTRGGNRSVPLDRVLEQARRFVDEGGQELVLSGINLGRWGRDLEPRQNFAGLVEALLVQTELPRLRISSVEPMDWTDRVLDLYRAFSQGPSPRLARHAHLPLQSGSDAILRAMYRRYRPWHYAQRLESIREAIPGAAIGADVMVGFPGETEALFEETYRFIEQQPFTYLHLFPFSARPGTPAWELHKQKPLAGEAVRERMARLRALIEAKHRAFRAGFIGSELSVVTLQTADHDRATGVTRALSDNFITVELHASLPPNRMLSVFVDGWTEQGLSAQSLGPEVVTRRASRAPFVASQMLY